MSQLILALALQALREEEALCVLGDAVLEAGWFDEHIFAFGLRLSGFETRPTTIEAMRERHERNAARPRRWWARSIAAVLLFGSFQTEPWEVVLRCRTEEIRRFTLGFPVTRVAAGATARIEAQPQVPFRGRRLIIPVEIADRFMVNEIRVENIPVLAGLVPGTAFTYDDSSDMFMDTANAGNTILLSVTNVSAESADFIAALVGDSLGLGGPYPRSNRMVIPNTIAGALKSS